MKKILTFTDKECRKVGLSGGKGGSLAHMTQYGIPVPPGFVVSSRAYEEVVDNKIVEKLLRKINLDDIETVNDVSIELQKYILSLKIPNKIETEIYNVFDELNLSLVAVRSSATSEDTKDASWAGELKTFLNTPKEKLLEMIKECWASLFSPRALLYRYEKGFSEKNISVSVVIQEMIQSEISGVCFTVHPVSMRRDHMLIESVFGLGESIVSGQVTPDSYLYDKDYDVILRIEPVKQMRKFCLPKNLRGIVWEEIPTDQQSKQKLNYKQIMELAAIFKKVESYYKMPQDIEWAFWAGSFYILQSRPITTL
jgi:pyruvate,water dikinase